MKYIFRTMFVVIAAVIAFTAVQVIGAADCSETIEGTVTTVNADANTIVVDGITVKGIPLVYLANQYNIMFVEGVSYVVVTGHLCILTDNKVRACSLSVDGGAVIDLPGR